MAIEDGQYSIGAVARLTGLTTHTIRKWEDRYQAITPERSSGGDRRYTRSQAARLNLLKELVDSGHSISRIARLPTSELQELCTASLSAQTPVAATRARIGVLGDSLPEILLQHRALMPKLDIAAAANAASALEDQAFDVLICEQATLDESTAQRLETLKAQLRTDRVVILYGYAPQAVAMRFSTDTTACLRMPINFPELQRTVLALTQRQADTTGMGAPAKRYPKAVLAKVAALSPTIACECPRHVAELIFALSDFEAYSAACESRSPEDAVIHNYLAITAAGARAAFEAALATVAEHENIPIDEWMRDLAGSGETS